MSARLKKRKENLEWAAGNRSEEGYRSNQFTLEVKLRSGSSRSIVCSINNDVDLTSSVGASRLNA
jgi:hypothetical protein